MNTKKLLEIMRESALDSDAVKKVKKYLSPREYKNQDEYLAANKRSPRKNGTFREKVEWFKKWKRDNGY